MLQRGRIVLPAWLASSLALARRLASQDPAPKSLTQKKKEKIKENVMSFHQLTACLPADGQERAGERNVKGVVRYLGSQAQVQCGPPSSRPAMYTTHGGTSTCACWPCLPPPSSSSSSSSYPAPCLTHHPKAHSSFDSRGVPFKPQSGDDGRGAIGAPSRSHNLESLCCRIVFFELLCACMPCLACPASLCHHAIMPRQWGSEPFLCNRPCATRLSRVRRSISIVATTQPISIVPRFDHNSVTQNIAMPYQTFCIEHQCNLEPLAR